MAVAGVLSVADRVAAGGAVVAAGVAAGADVAVAVLSAGPIAVGPLAGFTRCES